MTTRRSQEHSARHGLPPELWVKIIESCPRGRTRTCLSVNKLFHDIALPIVFGRVVLSFGSFEAYQAPLSVTPRVRDWLHGLEQSRTSRALEILERITEDQAFADVIKTLQVRACYDESEMGRKAVADVAAHMERFHATIPSLKRLRVFLWHWSYPRLTEGIVQTLAESCPLLERFEAPAFSMQGLPVHLLRNVKAIRTTWSDEDYTDLGIHGGNPVPVLESLLEKMQRPLTSQSNVESSLLHNVTDLELLFHDEYAPRDLQTILRHAPCVQSLAMVPVRGDVDDEPQDKMYNALAALPSELPSFNSLAIGPVDQRITEHQLGVLCSFLKSRPQLRRFSMRCTLTVVDVEPLFEALATLKKLEVLALYFGCEDLGLPAKEWIHRLLDHVPAGLTALALDFDQGFANKETFTELWSRLPALEFVYVRVLGGAALTPNQFIRGASNLQVVCFQDRFYDVEKVGGELRVVTPPWSSPKVRFRAVEDFGCADWEWLMRQYEFFDYMPADW
ncbi:hypothetical protein DAEQUDRAFT_584693 [Daedalea quercina L-15889]|uniref:Uncharacterized protein n=1 Tax=Daedalea quercina L-15889 TaxID=1314783 RepID=A0A165LQI1_9APHY|nr:hypothetical protein DAEQUDRAFT_584693 [Daedalea quercina L-15889]